MIEKPSHLFGKESSLIIEAIHSNRPIMEFSAYQISAVRNQTQNLNVKYLHKRIKIPTETMMNKMWPPKLFDKLEGVLTFFN